jgi:UDP-MurNAc hydroxylase
MSMRITHIANACSIYEANGIRILSDPWLTFGAFEGSWGHYPDLATRPQDVKDVDALYISHLHPDHFDPETLKVFRRDIPIFILNQKKHPNILLKKLEALGFKAVILISDGESFSFKSFLLTMYAPFCKHPFEDSELGNFIDSALV